MIGKDGDCTKRRIVNNRSIDFSKKKTKNKKTLGNLQVQFI